MIAPLRRRHGWTFLLLAIALPTLVVAALSHRSGRHLTTMKIADPPPPEALPIPSSSTVLDPLFEDPPSRGHLWTEGPRTLLAIDGRGAMRQPDVLLYWTPSTDGTSQGVALPPDAVLLGPMPSRSTRLFPLPTSTAGGQLLLYSLAHQELTARATLPEVSR